MPKEELKLSILREVETVNTQRELSEKVGCSVGTVNSILKILINDGYVSLEGILINNKLKNKYSLSKKGEEYRYELTEKFLEKKKNELQALEQEFRNEKR